ncbi:MAG TPA: PIN domain-containing protein [Vicinamibacterales bacterium]|nr:PIN domain-containing protein [Vicinamibacterales bacterium]
MAVVLDTGIVYAYYDRSDTWHQKAAALIKSEAGGLLLPAPVIPEVDHLLGHRLGSKARQTFYRGLIEGDYTVIDLPSDAYDRVAALDRRFPDLNLGFVDAAVALMADRMRVPRVATADRRHFEPLAGALGFEILP